MSRYQQTISNLIASQFPSLYTEDGPTLVAFLEAYYEWMEQTGNTLYYTRNLYEISDIDNTLDEFVVHFTKTYLSGIQYDILADKRLTVKKIIDLYGAKGSLRALKLLFQLVFKEDIDVYFPGADILKPSDGKWTIPVYLEVVTTPTINSYLNKMIIGVNSGATAFVDRIVTRKINGKFVTVFYITNQSKDFQAGEILSTDGDLNDSTSLVGSLNGLTVVQGSYGFYVGETVDVISPEKFGKNGKARVISVQDTTGVVSFKLVDGGWGYTTNAQVLISQSIIYLSNVQSNTSINTYPIEKFSTVTITNPGNLAANVTANVFAYSDTANLYLSSVSGTFVKGETVYSSVFYANSSTTLYSNAVINLSFPIKQVSNVTGGVTGAITYTGTATGYNNSDYLVVSNTTGAVVEATANITTNTLGGALTITVNKVGSYNVAQTNTGLVVQAYAANGAVSNGTGATFSATLGQFNVLTVGNIYSSYFKNGLTVTGVTSGATGSLYKTDTDIGVISISGTVTANHTVLTTTTGNAIITGESTGINANLSITSVAVTENIPIFGDFIAPYSAVSLNASTYGFPKFPSANQNTRIIDALQYTATGLGSITSVYANNPGQGYNDAPYVEIYEPCVAALRKKDYNLGIANVNGNFAVGEVISQTVSYTGQKILGISGAVYPNSSPGTYTYQEVVYQSNGASNVAVGVLFSSNSSVLYVNTVSGTFTTLYSIKGLSSSVNATVTSVASGGATQSALGLVTFANTSTLYAIRQTAAQDLISSTSIPPGVASVSQITGTISGATANIVSIAPYGLGFSGDNAVVTSNVITGNGSVTSLLVVDSGFGYTNSELIVNFRSLDGVHTGTAIPIIQKQGMGSGFYAGTNGFLSDNKYIQDGNYYQSFSYEIESSLDVSKYAQLVKDVVHVAGTKMFGTVIKRSVLNTGSTIDNSNTGPIIG